MRIPIWLLAVLLACGCGSDESEKLRTQISELQKENAELRSEVEKLKKTDEHLAQAECKTLAVALDHFADSHQDQFPHSFGYPEVDAEEMLNWLFQQGFLKSKPIDPWRKSYRVEIKRLREGVYLAMVISAGRDGNFGTEDDIAENGFRR